MFGLLSDEVLFERWFASGNIRDRELQNSVDVRVDIDLSFLPQTQLAKLPL